MVSDRFMLTTSHRKNLLPIWVIIPPGGGPGIPLYIGSVKECYMIVFIQMGSYQSLGCCIS